LGCIILTRVWPWGVPFGWKKGVEGVKIAEIQAELILILFETMSYVKFWGWDRVFRVDLEGKV